MIRIGVVNIDVSHPKAFSDYLARGTRARYVAVYNDGFRGDDEVEGFMRSFGLERRFTRLEEMVDFVDIGFVQGCNWNKHLGYAAPFIEKQKPVFIDKPIVGNIKDCRMLEDHARRGAVILGSSSLRYAKEIDEFLALPKEERGRVVHVFGTVGTDEFNYAIHIVEAIGGLMGEGAVSCRFVTRATITGAACDTYCIRYASGATAQYSILLGTWMPCHLTIMSTTKVFHLAIDTATVYGALLDRICDFMETGTRRLASVSELTESVKIMLAGRISREQSGREIGLADIPAEDPGYDGDAFEHAYARAARKIYLV